MADQKPTPYEAGLYAYGGDRIGDRIRAIRLFRARTGVGMRESMDAFRRAHPPRRKDWERMDPDERRRTRG